MSTLELKRLGIMMSPKSGNPHEVEGVPNPAAIRGPDGKLYLFPRLVGAGNFSRIGIALEPEADHELRTDGSGGCEDPRISFVKQLRRYVMTYTTLSRIALAISEDLFHWKRLGLAIFEPFRGIDFVHVDNKDAS